MRKFIQFFGIFLSLCMTIPLAHAQKYDLANVKVGMTLDEVEAAMTSNGYTPYKRSISTELYILGPSFAQLVAKNEGERIRRADYESISQADFSKDEENMSPLNLSHIQAALM